MFLFNKFNILHIVLGGFPKLTIFTFHHGVLDFSVIILFSRNQTFDTPRSTESQLKNYFLKPTTFNKATNYSKESHNCMEIA